MEKLTTAQIASFWDRVTIKSENECWEWSKGRSSKKPNQNYGIVWFNAIRHKTHRLAFQLNKGQLIDGMNICHKCDNPPCCNPSHLFQGTPKENTRDCIAKGRMKKEIGSARYNAILTEEIVAQIKKDLPNKKYGWSRKIARKYGIKESAIWNIISGLRWKHVKAAK